MHYIRKRKGADMNLSKGVNPKGTPLERLMKKVKKYSGPNGDCWEFFGAKRNGYGTISFDGKGIKAHRFSWQLHNNKKIPEGLCILHSCDNRCCVNPKHLSLGTQKENIHQMFERGRANTQKGEGAGRSKLKVADVLFIYKEAHRNKIKKQELAIQFNVTTRTIYDIKIGKSWSHTTKHGGNNGK